jgi:pantoate--beta-alanine ligase
MRIMAVGLGNWAAPEVGRKNLNKRAPARLFKPDVATQPPLRLMQKIVTVSEMRSLTAQFKRQGKTIALVATQGALHGGQEALMHAAAERADVVVVSIFVNPLQFGPSEVLANYPRSLEADLQQCETCGVDVVFVPSAEEMYPRGFSSFISEETISKSLCGISRPVHFRGVTTLMGKLLNLVRPDYAFFGQKTAQRAAVVRKMAGDLLFDTEVVVVPTVREPDGLAASVSNRLLSSIQRREALAIHEALECAKGMVDSGVRNPDRLIAEATHVLGRHLRVRVIYVTMVDPITLEPMREVVPGQTLLAIAAWIDEVRLIDNVLL